MDKHVFGFPGSTSGSNLIKLKTWVIGLSGCHARDTKHELNNPVVKVSELRPSTLTTGLLVLLFTRVLW